MERHLSTHFRLVFVARGFLTIALVSAGIIAFNDLGSVTADHTQQPPSETVYNVDFSSSESKYSPGPAFTPGDLDLTLVDTSWDESGSAEHTVNFGGSTSF